MSHSIRNSMILLSLLLITSLIFFFKNSSIKKDIALIENNLKRNEQDLASLASVRPDTMQIVYLKHQIDYQENWIINNSKAYLNNDNSQITWKYLQNLINRFAPEFQFNFVVTQRQDRTQEYTISGKTNIVVLYKFINYIEKQLALYTIENLQLNPSLQETDSGPANIINFTVVLKPWVDNQAGKDIIETPLRRISFKPLVRDPLRAQIHRPLNDPRQDKFINYESLVLVSYTEDKAFFLRHNKQIVALNFKEKIAYGYFSHIDKAKREAIFKINKTGLYETVSIPLDKGN